ncbi:C40 family peptidase [Nonomuraea salmonea]|uniref:C40 family peptidase n=1 Tax=Nonomuraea salmonea TaxID=46181 RepID=UPI002FE89933
MAQARTASTAPASPCTCGAAPESNSPHNAAGQYRAVRTKVSWRNLKPGDLMLLYGYGHVGIYVGGGRWVHAPGKGRPVRKESIHGWVRSKFNGAVRPGM